MKLFNLPPNTIDDIGSIEIVITDPVEYKAAYAFYQRTATMPILTLRGGGYSIYVYNIELRLLNAPIAPGVPNRTIIYWLVPTGEPSKLNELYEKLLKTGQYREVLCPTDDVFTVPNKWNTRRAVLAEVGKDNEFGLVINPPYPRKKGLPNPRKKRLLNRKIMVLVLGSATGILLGILMGKRRMRPQRAAIA